MSELNRVIVAETGEPFLVRDVGLLDSACHRPINRFQYEAVDDVWVLAVELLFGICRTHAFEQGNKRTGFESAVLFLQINGYELDAPDTDDVAQMIVEAIIDPDRQSAFEDVVGAYGRPIAG